MFLLICGGPLSMHEYVLFEDKGGRPVARTVRGRDGSVRVADGVVLFDLGQAVVRFGMTRGKLLELWEESYADIPWASSPVASEEESGEAGSESEAAKNDGGGLATAGGKWEAPGGGRPGGALRRGRGGELADGGGGGVLGLGRGGAGGA